MKKSVLILSILMLSGCTLDTSCYDFWKGGNITFKSGLDGEAQCNKK